MKKLMAIVLVVLLVFSLGTVVTANETSTVKAYTCADSYVRNASGYTLRNYGDLGELIVKDANDYLGFFKFELPVLTFSEEVDSAFLSVYKTSGSATTNTIAPCWDSSWSEGIGTGAANATDGSICYGNMPPADNTCSFNFDIPAANGFINDINISNIVKKAYERGDSFVTLCFTGTATTIRYASKEAGSDKQSYISVTKKDKPLDEADIDEALSALTLGDISSVKTNLVLPSAGLNGTTIEWESNNTDYVSDNGAVTRPVLGDGNKTVTLTATVSKGQISKTKAFTVTVSDYDGVVYASEDTFVYKNDTADSNQAAAAYIALRGDRAREGFVKFELSGITGVVSEAKLVLSADVRTYPCPENMGVEYISDDTWIADGLHYAIRPKAVGFAGNAVIEDNIGKFDFTSLVQCEIANDPLKNLSALIYTIGDSTTNYRIYSLEGAGADNTKKPQIIYRNTTEPDRIKAINDMTSLNLGELSQLKSSLTLVNDNNGSAVSWLSSNEAVISGAGAVVRPELNQSDASVILNAAVTYNGYTATRAFWATVPAYKYIMSSPAVTSAVDGVHNATFSFTNDTDKNSDITMFAAVYEEKQLVDITSDFAGLLPGGNKNFDLFVDARENSGYKIVLYFWDNIDGLKPYRAAFTKTFN